MLARRFTRLAAVLNVALASSCSSALMSSSDGGLSKGCVGAPAAPGSRLPLSGDESIMSPKKHGTTATPVQANLRWGIADALASRICSYNRHYAEPSGSWVATSFLREADRAGTTTFFDSVTGRPLFMAPRGRSFEEWERESRAHGWPSFRDEEVVWDDVRVLPDGEAVSVGGTHLGHNLPDKKGNRYCINLCSVAGRPADGK